MDKGHINGRYRTQRPRPLNLDGSEWKETRSFTHGGYGRPVRYLRSGCCGRRHAAPKDRTCQRRKLSKTLKHLARFATRRRPWPTPSARVRTGAEQGPTLGPSPDNKHRCVFKVIKDREHAGRCLCNVTAKWERRKFEAPSSLSRQTDLTRQVRQSLQVEGGKPSRMCKATMGRATCTLTTESAC